MFFARAILFRSIGRSPVVVSQYSFAPSLLRYTYPVIQARSFADDKGRASEPKSSTPKSSPKSTETSKTSTPKSSETRKAATSQSEAKSKTASAQKQDKADDETESSFVLSDKEGDMNLLTPPHYFDSKLRSGLTFRGTSGRMVQNLFVYGGHFNKREEILEELNKFSKFLEQDKEKIDEVFGRDRPEAERKKIVNDFLTKLKPSIYLSKIIETLFQANKLEPRYLRNIITRYRKVMEDTKGVINGTLLTAKPLSARMLEAYRTKILENLPKGQQLNLENKVDPSIISGFILDWDLGSIDQSVQQKYLRALELKEREIKNMS